jgi:hypothetical protein
VLVAEMSEPFLGSRDDAPAADRRKKSPTGSPMTAFTAAVVCH